MVRVPWKTMSREHIQAHIDIAKKFGDTRLVTVATAALLRHDVAAKAPKSPKVEKPRRNPLTRKQDPAMATVRQCDRCHLNDKQIKGDFIPFRFSFDPSAEVETIDLCSECSDVVGKTLAPLLKMRSLKPRKNKAAEASVDPGDPPVDPDGPPSDDAPEAPAELPELVPEVGGGAKRKRGAGEPGSLI